MTLGIKTRKLSVIIILCAIPLFAYLIIEGGILSLGILVAIPVIILTAFIYPSLLLSLLIVSNILQEIMFVSLSQVASLNQAVGIILFLIVFLKALMEKRIDRLGNAITYSLSALLGVLILSYLILSIGYESPLQDIDQFIRSYIYFLICLLIIRDKRDLALIAIAYIVGAVVVAVSGVFWKAIVIPIDYLSQGRRGIEGIPGQYIEYAVRCMIPLPIILHILAGKRLFHSRGFGLNGLLLGIAVVLSISVLLSGSRGAVIAYFFMVSLFVILSKTSVYRKMIISSLLFLFPFYLPINEILGQIIMSIRGQIPLDYSMSMRASFLSQMLGDIDLSVFLWGRGLENFRDYYSGVFNAPHSIWVQSFYELGMVGLSIQIYLLYKIIKIFLRLRKMEVNQSTQHTSLKLSLGLGASIFVFFFWGLYENIGLINGSKYLFVLLGAFMAGSRMVMSEA